MKLSVCKSSLRGTVPMPGSKSHTIRAVTVASLAEGQSAIRRPLVSGDTLSAVDCYRALGARIDTTDPDVWTVTGIAGRIHAPEKTIDVGNSGTTLRLAMASAALAGRSEAIEFTGDEQIRSRPLGPLIASLNQLGAKAESLEKNDKAPVRICGTFKGGKTTIKCLTSQYLSSLLLAAPLAENDTEIEVTLLNEPDYVRMTLDWLDKQQIQYQNDSMKHFRILGRQTYKPFDLPIPADFSSATFFLCAGAMLQDTDITLTGLDFADSQPDKSVVDYILAMGADVAVTPSEVRIRTSQLHGAEIDMNRTPDALPALAVAAAFASGPTRLVNVPQARSKETDRIACMAQELKKLGSEVEELEDGLIINPRPLQPARLHGRGDHRIVMALSLAGMALPGTSVIETAEAMSVTFPDYVKLMTTLGAQMEVTQ